VALAMDQNQENGIGDDHRVSELQQSGEALAEKGIVAGRQDGAEIDRYDDEQAREVPGVDLVTPSPEEDQAGETRRSTGQRDCRSNLQPRRRDRGRAGRT
jgi:hypothetical protein